MLDYCGDGNRPAVLDGYAYLLVESRGCIGASGDVVAREVASTVLSALSPRAASLSVDDVRIENGRVMMEPFRIRAATLVRNPPAPPAAASEPTPAPDELRSARRRQSSFNERPPTGSRAIVVVAT